MLTVLEEDHLVPDLVQAIGAQVALLLAVAP
jgi:hypothetical protein